MKTLGNILWFVFAGLWIGLSWVIIGALWCITIIGIPIGLQCFKIANVAFFPFKKSVDLGGGAGSLILNILWIVFGGIWLALEAAIIGVILCITIVGIPFGLQCFKFAKISLAPFGAEIRDTPSM